MSSERQFALCRVDLDGLKYGSCYVSSGTESLCALEVLPTSCPLGHSSADLLRSMGKGVAGRGPFIVVSCICDTESQRVAEQLVTSTDVSSLKRSAYLTHPKPGYRDKSHQRADGNPGFDDGSSGSSRDCRALECSP